MGLSCNRTGAATLFGALTLAGLSLPGMYVTPVLGNEISPDQTLGDESSTLRQVNDRRTQVEGGAIRGRHLFHSFSDFNIRELQEVYFANPSGIEAILGRITGDRPSSIFGTLGVDGEASLFLLNPNGFVFGENAVLDIRGSFVASTSDRFEFANGLDFSATHPNAAPLLTVDVPVGIQLGEFALGDIDSLAQLSTGQDLTLDGRDIAVQGGLVAGGDVTVQATHTLQVRDQVGQPFLASAGGQLELQGNAQLDISALSHPESYVLAGDTLTLRSSTPVIGDGRFQSGDSFRVETLEEQPGDLRSPNDPVIRSAGDVTLNTYEGTSLHILAGGQVTANAITVTGAAPGTVGGDFLVETVPLSNGGSVDINGGDRPTVDIRAGMLPSAIGNPEVSGVGALDSIDPANPASPEPTSASIDIDLIAVTAPNGQVLLTNQFNSNDELPGGAITIGSIRTDDGFNGFTGNAGDVVIDARGDVVVGDRINASSATGDTGDITVISEGDVTLDRSYIISNNNGAGIPGDIIIHTNSLTGTNGGQIRANTTNRGNAGRIEVYATGTVDFSGVENNNQGVTPREERSRRSGITNSIINRDGVDELPLVTSGGIRVEANQIEMSNGAQFQARVEENANGDSGDIDLIAAENITFRGINEGNSNSITTLEPGARGTVGDINLWASEVELLNGGQLRSNTAGNGPAGNITIRAEDRVVIAGDTRGANSRIFTVVSGRDLSEQGVGNAGDISIHVTNGSVDIRDRGALLSEVEEFGIGAGGNITVIAQDNINIADNASISSSLGRSGEGTAGNIYLESRQGSIDILESNIVSSSNSEGDSGRITVLAQGIVDVRRRSTISSDLRPQGIGEAGAIRLESRQGSVRVRNETNISSQSNGEGAAGDITLLAYDDVIVRDGPAISSALGRGNTGRAGNILLQSQQGSVTIGAEDVEDDGARITSQSNGNGASGDITIIAQNDIAINNRANIQSLLENQGVGRAGDILIHSQGGSITASGQRTNIVTQTNGEGNAGNITLRAADRIALSNARISSDVERTVSGSTPVQAGDILLEARSILASDFSEIEARTDGRGNSGNIRILAEEDIVFRDRVDLQTEVRDEGIGNAGSITIEALRGSIVGNRRINITARVVGEGSGGEIFVRAGQGIVLSNRSAISTVLERRGEGRAGSIFIDADSLELTENARLEARTLGVGEAGGITVNLEGDMLLDGGNDGNFRTATGVYTSSEAVATGSGGDIDINARSLSVTNSARLTASTFSDQNAGNVNVTTTDRIVVANDGVISGGAEVGATGNGGEIHLRTQTLELLNGGRVETRTQGFVPAILAEQIEGDAYEEVVAEDQPAAYWQLDEEADATTAADTTAADSSGNGFEGNYNGAIAPGQPGVSNTAVAFSREGSTINVGRVPEGSPLDLQDAPFTVEAWIQPNADPPDQQTYFSLVDGEGDNALLNLQVTNEGRIQFQIREAAPNNPNRVIDAQFETEFGAIRFGTGEWFHVVARYDEDTDASSIFVNGELVARSIRGPYVEDEPTVSIGARRNLNNRPFDGTIDEVAVYGEALSNQEVFEHYLAGRNSLNQPVQNLRRTGAEAGSITIEADSITISGRSVTRDQASGLFSGTEGIASGSGGDIEVDANVLRLSDGGLISAVTQNQSPGGNIRVNVDGNVVLRDDGVISASTSGAGRGGTIEASARNLRLNTDAQLLASTSGSGDGGAIRINVDNQVLLQNGATISASTSGAGNGGRISVRANEVIGEQGGRIAASTSGAGNGGVIRVNAADQVRFSGRREHNGEMTTSGIFSTAERGLTGNGGRITVMGDRLLLDDRGQISATTFGTGEGGDVRVMANQLTVQGRGAIEANTTRRRNGGQGGSIEVNAERIDLLRNGQISTSSTGSGDAGGIVFTEVDRLQLQSGGAIAATTSWDEDGGMGGTIEIAARRIHVLRTSTISASTAGSGTGGRVFIEADEVEVFEGGQMLTNTAGSGDAGNLELLVTELIDVAGEGSGLFANTTDDSSGNGGNIVIDPELVLVRDGAEIGVSSEGTGQGGSVDITADRLEVRNGGRILANNSGLEPGGDIRLNTDLLFLEDGATISASTASVNGGNIDISADDLVVMRQGSRIRTDAGEGDAGIGNGGNIAIATTLLLTVLSENNDISANAVRGQGGSVTITAPLGIYGIELRDEPTPLSDITVSSTFGSSGSVILNTPDVDPNRGTSELPSDFVSPAFNQVCQADGSAGSSRFVDAGRGGVPLSADAVLSSLGSLWDDGRSLNEALQTANRIPFLSPDVASTFGETTVSSTPTVEAQGWAIQHGQLILAPQSTEIVPYSSLQMPLACGEMTATPRSQGRSPAPASENPGENSGENAIDTDIPQPQEELE